MLHFLLDSLTLSRLFSRYNLLSLQLHVLHQWLYPSFRDLFLWNSFIFLITLHLLHLLLSIPINPFPSWPFPLLDPGDLIRRKPARTYFQKAITYLAVVFSAGPQSGFRHVINCTYPACCMVCIHRSFLASLSVYDHPALLIPVQDCLVKIFPGCCSFFRIIFHIFKKVLEYILL